MWRVKHGEITEQASSSGRASSHFRVDPAEVETKKMDTEEQARAKRELANISRMVSSVRGGWSIKQMTMAMC